jgi:aryl-alcohol dehydrogenase-like predicted oxidoreductase
MMPASDIIEAQWVAERRGLERFHTEQPPYSLLNRSIEREMLPVAQRYGVGTLVWGPLGQGMLTGRVRTDGMTSGDFGLPSPCRAAARTGRRSEPRHVQQAPTHTPTS